ncbi:MAG TPA: M15 family metallopeptidase [Rhizomicrobium sp.]|jgi:hypothetical protein|nr:M15 family metallopeptidase [Rhizomicrobium sp.]
MDAIVFAYPDRIANDNQAALLWHDGTRMPLGADDLGKSFTALLSHATIRDMFRLAYPAGAPLAAPAEDFDPGRFRNKAFFDHLYGDCRKGEVEKTLVPVVWLPHAWGRTIKFTPRAAGALRAVSAEIDALPAGVRHAAWPVAGTYACRGVADQGQPSMHAYGAAVDLNLAVSNYWLWDSPKSPPVWRNRMPREIVDIFERHGFIWGGRWYHYDTMHFEYRPELLARSQGGL